MLSDVNSKTRPVAEKDSHEIFTTDFHNAACFSGGMHVAIDVQAE
jgi:hypothetical protein